jgi:hypothetical protein
MIIFMQIKWREQNKVSFPPRGRLREATGHFGTRDSALSYGTQMRFARKIYEAA